MASHQPVPASALSCASARAEDDGRGGNRPLTVAELRDLLKVVHRTFGQLLLCLESASSAAAATPQAAVRTPAVDHLEQEWERSVLALRSALQAKLPQQCHGQIADVLRKQLELRRTHLSRMRLGLQHAREALQGPHEENHLT